jgi:hypothetical protein
MADSANYPLLLLGTVGSASKRDKKRPFVPHGINHTVDRQNRIISPQFIALQSSMEAERVKLQNSLLGANPELVIVFETKGSVQNLYDTVRHIPGLEWLSDSQVEDVQPDEEAFDTEDPTRLLQGSVYLTASNQVALSQVLSLWASFQRGETMPRNFGAWKNLFLQLDAVRLWSPTDRLTESVRAYWQDMLEEGQTKIRFEIELTARSATQTTQQSRAEIQRLISTLGGRVLHWCQLEAIGYHAALVETDADAIRRLLSDDLPAIAHCPRVWRFQPQAQMLGIGVAEADASIVTVPLPAVPDPNIQSVVAVLDGLPQENHALLAGRLQIEDPDGMAADYPVRDRLHGTAMCSLVVWGELAANGQPQHAALFTPVYVRPIFEAGDTNFNGQREERFPHAHLMVDLIERAVRRIKVGESEVRATAPNVKVINLSIGNRYAPFNREPSPLARLLDWLSVKYDVLFVVSAGNHSATLDIPLNGTAFVGLSVAQQTALAWKALSEQASERRMLSPAEAVNALTVGALHSDNAPALPSYLIDLFPAGGTSPISAVGYGFKGSIKPELYLPGGRALFRSDVAPPAGVHRLNPMPTSSPVTGLRTAVPGATHPTALSIGTSNAAALVTRHAAFILEGLESMRKAAADIDTTLAVVDPIYYAVLVKSLLVHCARRESAWVDTLLPKNAALGKNANRQQRLQLARWFGHGQPDLNRALVCTEQRATAIGVGQLRDGEALEFRFPLPPCLRSQTVERRLTATLAWLSPVNSFDQRYRRAEMWFEPPGDQIGVSRAEFDHNQVRKGTVQHEVLQGQFATPYSDGDFMVFKVNCKAGAGKLEGAVRFALCVSLEVAEGIHLPIYEEIAARIQVVSQVRVAP